MTSYNEYEKLEKKWENWLFEGEDAHSVFIQLTGIVWKIGLFTVILRARQITADENNGQFVLNVDIHSFINELFVNEMLMSARRLSDKAPLEGDKGVVSLWSIIEDIKINRGFITRSNYLRGHGLEYDIEVVRQKHEAWREKELRSGKAKYAPREIDESRVEFAHLIFDQFSGVDRNNRTPEDIIPASIFSDLQERLIKDCKEFKLIADKNIAHASSQTNRPTMQSIDIGRIKEVAKNICSVQSDLDKLFRHRTGSYNWLATPQYELLENIEKPWIKAEKVDDLYQAWNLFDKEAETW